jgi:hypothetical protein
LEEEESEEEAFSDPEAKEWNFPVIAPLIDPKVKELTDDEGEVSSQKEKANHNCLHNNVHNY